MLAGIVTGGIGYSSRGIDISGDMSSLLPQYTTAKIELVGKLPAGSPGCQSVGLHFPGVWDGGMIAITSAGTTVSVGQVLQVSNSQDAVGATGGAPVLGVAMGAVATSATGSCVPYANRGFVTATATGTPTEGALLVANSAGTSTTVTATGGCTVGIEQNPPYNAIYLAPGGFIPDLTTGVITSGTISGAAVIKTAQPIDGLIFGSNVGTAIASASTIAPTTGTVHVTGTTAISTITAASFCTQTAITWQLTLIPDGAWTTTTSGNISIASTAVLHRALIMTYDPGASKWYPSY